MWPNQNFKSAFSCLNSCPFRHHFLFLFFFQSMQKNGCSCMEEEYLDQNFWEEIKIVDSRIYSRIKRLKEAAHTTWSNQLINKASIDFFYVPCPFRSKVIMALNKLLKFVVLIFVLLSPPLPLSLFFYPFTQTRSLSSSVPSLLFTFSFEC